MTWQQVDQAERPGIRLVRAEGVYLYYSDGSRAIDASSGPICVGIGHGRTEVADACHRQMGQVSYGFDTEVRWKYMERLKAFTPGAR